MATRFVMGQAVKMVPSRVVVGAAVVNLTLEKGGVVSCLFVCGTEGRGRHVDSPCADGFA